MICRANGLFAALLLTACTLAAFSQAARGDIINGNFEGGTTGYTSGYTFAATDSQSVGGYFSTNSNPQAFNFNGASFGDYPTGKGSMMLVDGSPIPNLIVWNESVAVLPNSQYTFSFYSASWGKVNNAGDPSPATLKVLANSVQLGSILDLPSADGVWVNYTGTFNSGSLSSFPLTIIDTNTTFLGNDFAIDDATLNSVPEPGAASLLALLPCLLFARFRRENCAPTTVI